MQGLLVLVIDPQIRFELPSAGNYPSLDRHHFESQGRDFGVACRAADQFTESGGPDQ